MFKFWNAESKPYTDEGIKCKQHTKKTRTTELAHLEIKP